MSVGYPLNQCGLYAIKTKARLAKVIGRSPNFLISRAFKVDLYRVWQEPKSSGGYRLIEAPRDDLKAIQRRIADLLQRVLPPQYLYSPVKGRSYIENALAHCGSREVRLLDVVNYFGSCDWRAVYKFFNRDLRCAPDVAWILTGLSTREGHLPQGSPCSPILSFYSCRDMWSDIATLVDAAGCRLSVYVDDVTVSGPLVRESLVWEVKSVLRQYGHLHHRRKERRHIDRSAEITGVIVGPAKVSVPHRHFKKLQAARLALQTTVEEEDRVILKARAQSLEAQVRHLKQRQADLP